MTAGVDDPALVARARQLAVGLLQPLPERVQHNEGVASRAAEVAVTVQPADRCLLVAAAWLHDIGYSPLIRHTGFHPVDGGLYLRDHGWDERLASLVAPPLRGPVRPGGQGFGTLMADFLFEDSSASDALTYADQTVGPHGRPMTVPYRIAEAIARHGPDSPNALAHVERVPYLLGVADRVEKRVANHLGAHRAAGWLR